MMNLPLVMSFFACLSLPSGDASPPQKASGVYVQIIPVKTQAQLDHTLALLQGGQEFSDVARTYSTHSTAGSGAVWGPLQLEELPPVRAESGQMIFSKDLRNRIAGFSQLFADLQPHSSAGVGLMYFLEWNGQE